MSTYTAALTCILVMTSALIGVGELPEMFRGVLLYLPSLPNRGSVAFVGLLTPDGKGYFSGSDTLSLNGRILSRTYEANYKVNEDCTGSYKAETSLGQVHSDFVLVGDGEEANVIRTDEEQVLTFSFKKQ